MFNGTSTQNFRLKQCQTRTGHIYKKLTKIEYLNCVYEKNSFKIFKVRFHKMFIVQVNFKITFQQDHIMLCGKKI